MDFLRKLLGFDKEVEAAVETAVNDTISAAETLMPDFAKIRDEQAKVGIILVKDGNEMVATGTRKIADGSEKLELAQKLGSRVKLRGTKLAK